jgi:hypothetical protein
MDSRESPITPTVGSVVLVRGPLVDRADPKREYPALVTYVHNQNCINAHVSNEEKGGLVVGSIVFNDDLSSVADRSAWKWMDYQVTTAAKAAQPAPAELSVLERVTAEHDELRLKFDALTAFFAKAGEKLLDPRHQALLFRQHDAMREYLVVLHQRVSLLKEGI